VARGPADLISTDFMLMTFPRLVLALSVFLQVSVVACPQDTGAFDRRQACLDLAGSLRLLCVAVHPGDEAARVLARYRKGKGVRTTTAFATGGEGGENAAGPELWEELRVVRMKEAEAAARVLGAETRYLQLKDFGFTRGAEEALERWGEDATREKLVRVIREARPHVVIMRGPITKQADGKRQALFKVLQDAIRDASDATKFDDLLQEQLYPWAVRRFFVTSAKEGATAAVDVGQRDPVLGSSYAEIGESARACHRSQGFEARPPEALPGMVYFRRVLPRPEGSEKNAEKNAVKNADDKKPEDENATPDLFEGLVGYDQQELELKEKVNFEHAFKVERKLCDTGQQLLELGPDDPRARALLIDALKALNKLNEKPLANRDLKIGEWFEEKGYQDFFRRRANELSEAVRECLRIGVSVRGESDAEDGLAADQRFPVDVKVTTDTAHEITNLGVRLEQSVSFAKTYVEQRNRVLTRDTPVFAYFKVKVLENAPPTRPETDYFRRLHRFLPGMRGILDGRIDDQLFAFIVNVDTPAVVAPVQLRARPARVLGRLEAAAREGIAVVVDFRAQGPLYVYGGRPEKEPLRFKLWITAPDQVRVEPSVAVVENWRSGKPSFHSFRFFPKGAVAGGTVTVHAQRILATSPEELAGRDYTTKVPFSVADCAVTPGVRTGVIAGHDQALVDGLKGLGIPVRVLDERVEQALLFSRAEDRIDTLFVGWRALEARPGVYDISARLLEEFVGKRGGVLVILCQRPEVWNLDGDHPRMTPFPLALGSERIYDETAPVEILAPKHPLMTTPNAIGAESFAGWAQERGHDFPSDVDSRYRRLLRITSPAGGTPLDTGLLVAEHGRGRVVYTSLALSRQLRAGVPGAFALLANLAGFRSGKE